MKRRTDILVKIGVRVIFRERITPMAVAYLEIDNESEGNWDAKPI